MKLKNIILSSAVAAAMMSGFAHAADNGEVSFLGAVTSKTCDIEVTVGGSVNNLVQLGNTAKGQSSVPVPFELTLKDAAACDLTAAGVTGAFVTWDSVSLNSNGISNLRGTATDADVVLKAKNSKTADELVTKAKNSIEFLPATISTDKAFKFEANIKSDAVTGTAGSVDTTAAFTVHYQ